MSVSVQQILGLLQAVAPPALALDWDNVGLLVDAGTPVDSVLRRWLARRGFALRAETLCQAAGRWYAVMNAQYTGDAREPDGLYCLTGLTQGQPGCADYYAVQNAKLKKYRLGLPEGEENEAVGKLIAELEHLSKP